MGVYSGGAEGRKPIQNKDVPQIFYHTCEMKKLERLYEKLMHAS